MISKKLSGKIITGLFAAMVGIAGVQGVTIVMVMMWVLGHMHTNAMIMKKMEVVQLCVMKEELRFMQTI